MKIKFGSEVDLIVYWPTYMLSEVFDLDLDQNIRSWFER